MSAPTLAQAVLELYDSIGGGLPKLWLDEVPEGQGYPRAVVHYEGEFPVKGSIDNNRTGRDGDPIVKPRFWIDVLVENDAVQAESLAQTIALAFKLDSVKVSFDPFLRIWRTGPGYLGPSAMGERSPANQIVYRVRLNYEGLMSPPY